MERKAAEEVVVVLGATGAGKSKLALEIAQIVGGEVVSADAMQIYEGLDIVTNKVTPEELEICPHHMIGITDPLDKFTAVQFTNRVLPIISDIQSRGKVPVIAGGTNYYIESVMWQQLLRSDENQRCPQHETYIKELENESAEKLHKLLQQNDPESALLIHPNDKRKVINALQVYKKTGIKLSDHHKNQRVSSGASGYGGPLRFPKTCMLWVQCQPQILEVRVRKRVDKMLERGLLAELQNFHDNYNAERLKDDEEADYTRGIFQSIGFKEFHNYLTTQDDNSLKKERMLKSSIAKMKLNTWKYAKYQVKWINKRLVRRSNAIPVFPFDASNPDDWCEKVHKPALKVLKKFFSANSLVTERLEKINLQGVEDVAAIEAECLANSEERRKHIICQVCGGLPVQASSWQEHIKSKKHRYNMKRNKDYKETHGILNKRTKQLEKSLEPKNRN